jgi:PBP1b-binding outer membrane lipoprotein LpoB
MSKRLCLVLSVILAGTMVLAACAPAVAPVQPTTAPAATAAPVQPTTVPAATVAPVQPTTAPGEIPQSGDLCEGTGGIGQIVSLGDNEFTMKRHDDGSDQVVHLNSQATIRTSAGSASLSDLKIGWSVTLAGRTNPDGSFAANIVFVCNGMVP